MTHGMLYEYNFTVGGENLSIVEFAKTVTPLRPLSLNLD